jgi:hypothetical protein
VTCKLDVCDKPKGGTICPAHRRQIRLGQTPKPLRSYGGIRRLAESRPGEPSREEYRAWRAKEFRYRLRMIKVDRGCTDCGYNDHPDALEFDHMPEYEKLFKLGGFIGTTWARILAEIDKCEVVCANCHRIRTRQRANWEPWDPNNAPPPPPLTAQGRQRRWSSQTRDSDVITA